jgi:predicted nuclease with TOPRIM domain
MDSNQKLVNILAEEKLSIEEFKKIIKERTQLSKKINAIKKQLDELNQDMILLEKRCDIRIAEICDNSSKVDELFKKVFERDLLETARIIRDNLPNTIKSKLQGTIQNPVLVLFEKSSGLPVGKVGIEFSSSQEYIAKVEIQDERNQIHCEDEFVLKIPSRVYKVIAYINNNLSYDE